MDAETRTAKLNDYLHDRLVADERKEVEDVMSRDADVRTEYEFLTLVRDNLVLDASRSAKDFPFEALMARIRQEGERIELSSASTDVPRGQRPNPKPGFLAGTFGWLFRPSLSYAVAASVLVAQFAVLAVFYQGSAGEGGFSEFRNQPTVLPVAGPFIRASLKPDTKESDIRFLLISLGATIVGGPTQLGDYFIYVPPERTDWAARQMRQSPIVEQVNVIATLPPLKD